MDNAAIQEGKRAPYPAYKPSAVEWLDDVPEHWGMKRLKFLSTLQTGLTLGKKYEGGNLVTRPYLRVANVQDGYLDLSTITEIDLPPEDVKRYELRLGDVLMTEGGDFDKLGRGYVWEGQTPGCLHQNHIFAVRPKQAELKTDFLAAVLTSSYGKNYFTSTSQQTTNLATTNSTKLRSFPIPLPPLDEQHAIAAFLDREMARIDALIEKKQRQIDLLQEKRAALISHAVTKGLNPNVKMKDSGIEWLGEIPEHWDVVSLRRYLRVSSGDMISINEFCEEGYPVFGGNGFRGYSDRWNTEIDTIIIGRYGALCGNVRVTEGRIWATEHAFRVIPLAKFHARFLASVIDTLDLNRLSARTAQPGLNSEMVRNNIIGIPPLVEQKAIADFIVSETSRFDKLVFKIEASIEKLREYRTALISAAVTGKIDVRQEVA